MMASSLRPSVAGSSPNSIPSNENPPKSGSELSKLDNDESLRDKEPQRMTVGNIAVAPGSEESGAEKGLIANDFQTATKGEHVVVDEFGLPVLADTMRPRSVSNSSGSSEVFHEAADNTSDKIETQSNGQHNCLAVEMPLQSKESEPTNLSREGDFKSSEQGADVRESNAVKEPVPITAPYHAENLSIPVPGAQSSNATADLIEHKELSQRRSLKQKTSTVMEEDCSHTSPEKISRAKHSPATTSEWSHQRLTQKGHSEAKDESEGEWQAMPALDEFDVYDDYGRLIARGSKPDDDGGVYKGLGGAGKGYTRIRVDEDTQSVTSMDEDTSYLFKDSHDNEADMGEELRDPLSQLQATKDLLTEGQRIAYVGTTRLAMYEMAKELENIPPTKASRDCLQEGLDSMKMWGQSIMVRLYIHMDIDSAEQLMIEQLAEHGVRPEDLVKPLMQNAQIRNPIVDDTDSLSKQISSATLPGPNDATPGYSSVDSESLSLPSPPPAYEVSQANDVPEVQTASQLPKSRKIDIDLRWTVLCDLFLMLIANSSYDSRSRSLLERVGQAMDVSWAQVCRFEKRVIDALEMEQTADKETWDETENMENRRKMALRQKYIIMGLATVGGGLVIGLSAGLLAPVIGAGLAAGFTSIGVSGTGAFLGGAGGAALIASGATLTGGSIGLKASGRRTGAVKTFEYRPLHNNKTVNLIVTVSGWMNGKVDDVRLPYSTVDPVMGDLYSVYWEPEMLQSMGSTINILATEALTQGLQQILGSTILTALMGALQLPIILTKLSYLIDNPWNVSLARANAAGLILADSIMDRNLGRRPITLLGFSLGSRVIFSCLKELANKGAYGLVQNVYIFGSPIVVNKDDFLKARSVISSRFVNGYSSNDWILGYLFRATAGGIMRVAGLAPVEGIPGLENINMTYLVDGHMAYRAAMPRLLRKMGWEVLSDEFAEIVDPDPDNHSERQRELIREIDEARKVAAQKPNKRRFHLFKRGKLARKKAWETYDPNQLESAEHAPSSNATGSDDVLFDIDAIRNELASEQIQVKQLESTLPPMKLDLRSPSDQLSTNELTKDLYPDLQQSRSADQSQPIDKNVPSILSEKAVNCQPSGSSNRLPRDLDAILPEGERIERTFDTSYHTSPARTPLFKPEDMISSQPAAPKLHSSSGVTTISSAASLGHINLEHNAWADGDIEHNDGDKIRLTFE